MTAKQNLDIENALTLLQCGQISRRRAVGALDMAYSAIDVNDLPVLQGEPLPLDTVPQQMLKEGDA